MSQAGGRVEFNVGDLLSSAWKLFSDNVGLMLGAVVLVIAIYAVGNAVSWGLAGLILGGPISLGFVALGMRMVRHEQADINVLFSGFRRFLPAFLANLIMTLFVFIGSMLCILPGLFVGVLYMLTFFYMYDKQYDFWEAMEASRKTVMENLGQWILLALVLFLLNLVGAIPCGVGLLVTVPLTVLMLGLAYEQVEGAATHVE